MAVAKRDDNNHPVMMGVDPNGDPAPVKIDHATGYVLLSITTAGGPAPTIVRTAALHDDNSVPTMIAASAAGSPVIPFVDHTNGYLWIA